MIKKILKKVLYVTPFMVAVFLTVVTFTGKAEEVIGKTFSKTDKKGDEEINIVYKDGMIDLNKTYEFYIEPTEEYYDSNNKVAKPYAYGLTENEVKYIEEFAFDLIDYDNSHPLEANQKGSNIFSKDIVKHIGEEYDFKSKHLKGKVTNIDISYEISDEELQYFLPDYHRITEYLDENNRLESMVILKKMSGENNEIIEERKKMDVCYLTADITYNSYSEWVQEADLRPEIVFLNEYDNRLEHMWLEDMCGYYSESKMVALGGNNGCASFSPWFYDFETQKNAVCTSVPMFKGEEYTVKVGYIIPVDFLDRCYLWYSYTGGNIPNHYNAIDDVLVKVKE